MNFPFQNKKPMPPHNIGEWRLFTARSHDRVGDSGQRRFDDSPALQLNAGWNATDGSARQA